MFLALSKRHFINLDNVNEVILYNTHEDHYVGFNNVFKNGEDFSLFHTTGEEGKRVKDFFTQLASTQRVEPEELDGLRARVGAILHQEFSKTEVFAEYGIMQRVENIRDRLVEALFHPAPEGGDVS